MGSFGEPLGVRGRRNALTWRIIITDVYIEIHLFFMFSRHLIKNTEIGVDV